MSNVKNTQAETVLNHLNKYSRLNAADAIALYGIMRLNARIFELRERGVKIDSVRVKIGDRWFVSFRLAADRPGNGTEVQTNVVFTNNRPELYPRGLVQEVLSSLPQV